MRRNNERRSTARKKPLADVTNSLNLSSQAPKQKQPAATGNDASLDRLLLIHTQLSKLLSEIDEVVVHALEHGMANKIGNRDLDSFEDCLSNMSATLEPWISRFKEAFAAKPMKSCNEVAPLLGKDIKDRTEECSTVCNIKEGAADLVVSPSPLVSWRTGACTIECGKQLFLLTPLPKSTATSVKPKMTKITTKPSASSASRLFTCDELPKTDEMKWNATGCIAGSTENRDVFKLTHVSPLNLSKKKSQDCSIYLLTPCLKSSLKHCPALDSISEAFSVEKKSSKFIHFSNDAQADSNVKSKSDKIAEDIELKCMELFGFDFPLAKETTQRRDISESLEWFLSPPKTCIPLEPPGLGCQKMKTVECTPMLNGMESTVQKGKKGETTLKRELWTKFQAVSGPSLRVGASTYQSRSNKGFLDMLEEVSTDVP